MRQFLLGASLSIAFILGCVTAQHVPSLGVPTASAEAGGGWEYLCEPRDAAWGAQGFARKLTERLNELGAAGWELAGSDAGGITCLKRPR